MPANSLRARKLGVVAVVGTVSAVLASTANAGPSPLTINLSVDGSPIAPIVDAGTQNAFVFDNRIEYVGSVTTADYMISWNFLGDVNPGEAFGSFQGVSLSGDITFINLTGATHDYELTSWVALNGNVFNSMYGGSYAVATTSSTEGGIPNFGDRPDMVLAALPGQAMYSAGLNGSTVHQDFFSPFSLTQGWGTSATIPETNYGGVPGTPNIPGPGVVTWISHSLAFSLTGSTPDGGSPMDYDRATFSMKLVVVPAPAALALLGVAGIAGRRRRRNA